MGIQGLLPFLKTYARSRNIKDFQGKNVGVDAMCWMHKGAFACARELVERKDTDKFIYYFLRMCEILRYHEITPIIVFDGDKLPAKAKEDEHRNQVREAAQKEAIELLARQEKGEEVSEKLLATKCQGAIKITSAMISRLQSALKELGIGFMVAPYEADAQLAYMCRRGWIHAVISEDSDLLAYGCPNTFFKMDKHGDGQHIALPCLQLDPQDPDTAPSKPSPELMPDDEAPSEVDNPLAIDSGNEENAEPNSQGDAQPLGRGRGRPKRPGQGDAQTQGRGRGRPKRPVRHPLRGRGRGTNKQISITLQDLDTWDPEKFAAFCILCGSDYKEPNVHISHLGVKKSFQLMCRHDDTNSFLNEMAEDYRWRDKLPCEADEYPGRFRQVLAVFWHHVVYDPTKGECVSIARSFPQGEERRALPGTDLQVVCGAGFPMEEARPMARGEIDPRSRKPRALEPLTAAERAALDRIVQQKRQDHREHLFHVSLHERAQEIKAENDKNPEKKEAKRKEKEEELRKLEARIRTAKEHGLLEADLKEDREVVAALRKELGMESEPAAMPGASDEPADVQDFDKDEEPRVQREFHLMPKDIRVLMSVRHQILSDTPPPANADSDRSTLDSLRSEAAATPAKQPNPFARKAAPVPTDNKPNPFARKRGGDTADSQTSSKPNTVVVPKRPRVSAAATTALWEATPSQPSKKEPEARPPPQRQMAKPEAHPRGGWAAKDAAAAVLAQRGAFEFAPVDPMKDKGKLTSWVKPKTDTGQGVHHAKEKRQTGVTKEEKKPKSSLKDWKARPWEADEPMDDFATSQNHLSLSANRGRTASIFGRTKW
eukprot:TRINITY_DN89838_c0_g1_i1.p1 TRINITY_DN89838_c0_g1~~TRINITY_DN89838_c0_g1_i1.p1  ORF type:complete len:844 (-),score=161.75 TRINITY_DN89838_c0_g1_i1:71-2557(-)